VELRLSELGFRLSWTERTLGPWVEDHFHKKPEIPQFQPMLKGYLSYSPIDLKIRFYYLGDRETLPDHPPRVRPVCGRWPDERQRPLLERLAQNVRFSKLDHWGGTGITLVLVH